MAKGSPERTARRGRPAGAVRPRGPRGTVALGLLALLGSLGCVETVDDYAGLSCKAGSAPCPSGWICIAGACERVTLVLEKELCNSDEDCEAPLHCNEALQRCRPCTGDADCAVPPAARCTAGGYCVQCLQHLDCGAGSRCDPDILACVGCGPGAPCPTAEGGRRDR